MRGPRLNQRSAVRTPASCDLVVAGSGAAGLCAAVTAAWHGLSVIVVEKDAVCGGATAWSGGWIWAPLNPLSQADGIVEDPELPRSYLRHELGEYYDGPRVDAFLEAAPRMVAFFEQHTALQFVSGTRIADIHGHTPGAGIGGRSVGPKPYDGRELGPTLLRRMRRQMYETSFLGMGIMAGPDLKHFLHATRSFTSFRYAARRIARHLLDLCLYGRGMHFVNGQALVGRLLKSADQLGVRIWESSPATRLVIDEGRVRGLVVATPAGEVTIRAQRGVVLAGGGFPHDIERRKQLFPRRPTGQEHWALPPEAVSGDTVRLGESAGGYVDTRLASPAAWCPVSLVRYWNGRTGLYPHIFDRAKPGVIGVLANGRRFVNEANGYHDYVTAMFKTVPPDQEVASWLICDHRYQRLMPFGMAKPFPVPTWPYVRSGYLTRHRTIEGLARACGIDPAGLVASIAEFNAYARTGEDPAFGRGSTPFNQRSGDPDHRPSPTLGSIERPPFYAIKVLPGSFGTFAGLKTDACARVLNRAGQPVAGLYAAGNDQASVMGGHYPSGGINLGPAMTFGFIAGRHAAGVLPDDIG